jgi:hypothetical protein
VVIDCDVADPGLDVGASGPITCACPNGYVAISGGFDAPAESGVFVTSAMKTGVKTWTHEFYNTTAGFVAPVSVHVNCVPN